jgi:DNA-binding response OmpR family regulator
VLARPFPIAKHLEHLETLRRGERVVPLSDPAELRFDGLVISLDEQRVRFVDGLQAERDAGLTRAQFQLLHYLASNLDRLISGRSCTRSCAPASTGGATASS